MKANQIPETNHEMLSTLATLNDTTIEIIAIAHGYPEVGTQPPNIRAYKLYQTTHPTKRTVSTDIEEDADDGEDTSNRRGTTTHPDGSQPTSPQITF